MDAGGRARLIHATREFLSVFLTVNWLMSKIASVWTKINLGAEVEPFYSS